MLGTGKTGNPWIINPLRSPDFHFWIGNLGLQFLLLDFHIWLSCLSQNVAYTPIDGHETLGNIWTNFEPWEFIFPSLQPYLLAETLQQQAEETVKTREHGHLDPSGDS
jgi:hypothetical protein